MINLYYNVTGQTIFFDAPEGRPSSITSVAVFETRSGDDDTAETATTGSSSVETNPNTTFDAASGVSETTPKVCNVAATTGTSIGRTYLATNATGEKEWVEVAEITSGASVTARNALLNDYANSDTFESTRISINVLDGWIQDVNSISDDIDPNPGYRVRWVYVVDSVTFVHDDYLNIVRYSADHNVRPQDVDAVSPGWLDMLPTEYREDQGRKLIDEAFKEIRFDLYRVDIPQEMMREKDVVNRLVVRKTLLMKQQASLAAGSIADLAMLEEARNEYQGLLQGLLSVVSRVDMAVEDGGASSRRAAVTLMEK